MSNENICALCGQKPGTFRSTIISCGGTWQTACKSCEKELVDLNEYEICRRVLVRGLAVQPEKIRERIALIEEAENHRPACLRCGGSIKFGEEQQLDNSPVGDGLLTDSFDVIPAWCETCGRMEFYHPQIVKKDPYLAYLIEKDSGV